MPSHLEKLFFLAKPMQWLPGAKLTGPMQLMQAKVLLMSTLAGGTLNILGSIKKFLFGDDCAPPTYLAGSCRCT